MKKNKKLNQWLWKWHVIAGLVSIPFVLLLSITGGIYLFKDNYEAKDQQWARKVQPQKQRLSYAKQWDLAKKQAGHPLNTMIVSKDKDEATKFVSGRFGTTATFYLNPYTGKSIADIAEKDTDMFTIRKLHGELLMGKYGTKIVELIASWLVVLILTGIYVWWPRGKFKTLGSLRVRAKLGRRTFFRDLHSVTAFWFSILLFMILLGGLPWTDVFGGGFKWVQEQTHTGFPATWQANGLHSQNDKKSSINIDAIVAKANTLNLPGVIKIGLPHNARGVFSISNKPGDPTLMEMHHFDRYSGKELVSNNWDDIGIMMQGRLFFMAFHQGQFGAWNKYLMLLVAIALFTLTSASLCSYVFRKKTGWGIPKVPASFRVGNAILILIGLLAIILPLFGISILLILVGDYVFRLDFK